MMSIEGRPGTAAPGAGPTRTATCTTIEAQGEACFEALLRRGVSFGLHGTAFQTMYPPRWGVWENDTTWFFNRVKALTS